MPKTTFNQWNSVLPGLGGRLGASGSVFGPTMIDDECDSGLLSATWGNKKMKHY